MRSFKVVDGSAVDTDECGIPFLCRCVLQPDWSYSMRHLNMVHATSVDTDDCSIQAVAGSQKWCEQMVFMRGGVLYVIKWCL